MKSLISHCDIYTCEHFTGNLSLLISDYSYKEKLLFELNCLHIEPFQTQRLDFRKKWELAKAST